MVSAVLPRIRSFEQQTIHNDFNQKNVLVHPSSPDHVSGIIDFGDMVSVARVVDLGVAIARHLEVTNTVEGAGHIVEGYNAMSQLSEAELSVLFTLICARLAIRSVIFSWRYALGDSRGNPGEVKSALEFLDIFYSSGQREVAAMFLRSGCHPN